MKVKELIKRLEPCDRNVDVYISNGVSGRDLTLNLVGTKLCQPRISISGKEVKNEIR